MEAAAETKGPGSLFLLPVGAYLRGVGPIYGGAAGARGRGPGGSDFAAFGTFGEVEAWGVLLGGDRIPGTPVSYRVGAVRLERADFETSYGRGFEDRLVVRQVIKGGGWGVGFGWDPFPDRLSLSFSYAYSSVEFVDYKTRDGRVIAFSKQSLHDVVSHAISIGAASVLAAGSKREPPRLLATGKFSSVLGRPGQSNAGILEFGLRGAVEPVRDWRLSYTTRVQKSILLTKASPGAVLANCGVNTDPELLGQCRALERDITSFVNASNAAGTAVPLGGSRGLRSYRELRFKAANTGFSGIEIARRLPVRFPVSLSGFFEIGQASDSVSTLFRRSRHSTGAGIRFGKDALPLRFEWATGREGPAYFATLGRAW